MILMNHKEIIENKSRLRIAYNQAYNFILCNLLYIGVAHEPIGSPGNK